MRGSAENKRPAGSPQRGQQKSRTKSLEIEAAPRDQAGGFDPYNSR
jgi:hypothetical protein